VCVVYNTMRANDLALENNNNNIIMQAS